MKYDDAIIFGDFNINLLNGLERLKLLNDHFKLFNNYCPTHSWPGASPTLIDIALTKRPDRSVNFCHYYLIPTTHHDMIIISYRLKIEKKNEPTSFSYRNYERIDVERLTMEANALNWSTFLESSDINEKVDIFSRHYYHLFNNCVPLVNVKLKTQSKPWFNVELNEDLKSRSRGVNAQIFV